MNEFDEMLAAYRPVTPQDRLNAIHEVMQQVTLAALSKSGFFQHAAFYGGTCLRIFHQLKRFSEDMDFSLLRPVRDFDFSAYQEAIVQEFASFGQKVEVATKEKTHKSAILSAFLKSDTVQYDIRLARGHKIKVKLEIDTTPPGDFATEQKLLLQPYSFFTRCYTPPCLFAGKMHALLYRRWGNRVKGRDWYDFVWYVRKGIPLDYRHFLSRVTQLEGEEHVPTSQEAFLDALCNRIAGIDWENAKEDVLPFVKDVTELDVWSTSFFLSLVDMMALDSTVASR